MPGPSFSQIASRAVFASIPRPNLMIGAAKD